MTECWRFLADDGVGAAEGLALDEALMAGYARGAPLRPPTLRLYTYRSHCALIGRYQHLEAEVDLDACRRAQAEVNRRPTGGGAIVMGEDQLGVAVVMRAPAGHPRELLRRFSEGVIEGLSSLGIRAAFGGKNDLEVGGKKITGLGLCLDGHGALLFHASVLAGLDVPFMLGVLRISAAKLGDKGVAAVEQRVTTVSRETGQRWTGPALRAVVARGFARALGADLQPAEPDESERRLASRLAQEKYGTEAWLNQLRPQPDATATALLKTPRGLVRLYLSLVGTTIKSAMVAGDFNEFPEALGRFEAALKWTRLDRAELRRVAAATLASDAHLGIAPDELADAVLEAGERARTRERAAPVRQEGSCYFPEVEADGAGKAAARP